MTLPGADTGQDPFAALAQLLNNVLVVVIIAGVLILVVGVIWALGSGTTRAILVGVICGLIVLVILVLSAIRAWGAPSTLIVFGSIGALPFAGVVAYGARTRHMRGWTVLVLAMSVAAFVVGAVFASAWPVWALVLLPVLAAASVSAGLVVGSRIERNEREEYARRIRDREERLADEQARTQEARRLQAIAQTERERSREADEARRSSERAEAQRKRAEEDEAKERENARHHALRDAEAEAVAQARAADALSRMSTQRQLAQQHRALHALGELAQGLAHRPVELRRVAESTGLSPAATLVVLMRLAQVDQVRLREGDYWSRTEWDLQQVSLTMEGVRQIAQQVAALPVRRLTIAYLMSNPDMDLRVNFELRAVEDRIKRSQFRDSISLSPLVAATVDDLLESLAELQPDIVHFSGHSDEAGLWFEAGTQEQPSKHRVPYEVLASTLVATDKRPTMIVLNGCSTLAGTDALKVACDFVVGILEPFKDVSAGRFAPAFYGAIASGRSLETALKQGAVMIDLHGHGEGWKPQLRASDSAPDPRQTYLIGDGGP